MRPRKYSEILNAVNFVPEEILPDSSSHVPVSDIVLATIALAGVISVAVVAPNALRLLKYVKITRKPKYDFPYRVPEVIRRLEYQGYITVRNKKYTAIASLTQKGRDALMKKKFTYTLTHLKKTTRWDGKWRFVIFDVSEKRKTRRDRFRDELKMLGFQRVQNSVWVFPYECKELILLLKMEKQVGSEVLYLESDNVENEKKLKILFGLMS